MIDTLIKGENHVSQYDRIYWAQDGGTFLLAIVEIFIPSRAYQTGFAVLFLVIQIWFIASAFSMLGGDLELSVVLDQSLRRKAE